MRVSGIFALLKLSPFIGLVLWAIVLSTLLSKCTVQAMPIAAPIEIVQEQQGE